MEIWGKKRTSRLAFLLLLIMLFNSFGVLAEGVAKGDDKLNLTISFDIRDDKSLYDDYYKKPSNIVLQITGNLEGGSGGAIDQDTVSFKAATRSTFIMGIGDDKEEKTKKNSSKKYYIDIKKLGEVYSNRLINFSEQKDNNELEFVIDIKRLSNKNGEDILEDILISTTNGILVENPEFTGLEDENYTKYEKDLDSIVGYFTGSSLNLYENIKIKNPIKIPKRAIKKEEVEKFLGKKIENLYDNDRDYNFNLIGYTIGKSTITTIGESEYNLINLIGMDRFVFLKSFKTFKDAKYPKKDDYKFEYEYKDDQMKLTYTGQISKEELSKEELELYKELLEKSDIKFYKKTDDKDEEVVDETEKIFILQALKNENIGSNIIAEILNGSYNINFIKDENKNAQDSLKNEEDRIRQLIDGDSGFEKKLKTIEYDAYLYKGESKNQTRMTRSFQEMSPTFFNIYNSGHYEYRLDRINQYYGPDFKDDLGLKDDYRNKVEGLVEKYEKLNGILKGIKIEDIERQLEELNIEDIKRQLEELNKNLEDLDGLLKIEDIGEEDIGEIQDPQISEEEKPLVEIKELNRITATIKEIEKVKKISEGEKYNNLIGPISRSIGELNENIDGKNSLSVELSKISSLIGEVNEKIGELNEGDKLKLIQDKVEEINTLIGDDDSGLLMQINGLNKDISEWNVDQLNSLIGEINGQVDQANSSINEIKDIIDELNELVEDTSYPIRDNKSKELLNSFANEYAYLKMFYDDDGKLKEDVDILELEQSLGEVESIISKIMFFGQEKKKNDAKIKEKDLEKEIKSLENRKTRLKTKLESSLERIKEEIGFISGDIGKFISINWDELNIIDSSDTDMDTIKANLEVISKNESLKEYKIKKGEDIKIYNLSQEAGTILNKIEQGKTIEEIKEYIEELNENIESLEEYSKILKKESEFFKYDSENELGDSIGKKGFGDSIEATLNWIKDTEDLGTLKLNYNPDSIKTESLKEGVAFKLVYKISESDNYDNTDISDYNRIPWIKLENLVIKDVEQDDYRGYNYIQVEHISGLYNKGSNRLDAYEDYPNYWMFNGSVSGDGKKYSNIIKMKTPKDKSLLINEKSLESLKPGYGSNNKFQVKLAYIRINDDIVWEYEMNKGDISKDLYSLENGNLTIYQKFEDNPKNADKIKELEDKIDNATLEEKEELKKDLEALKAIKLDKIQFVFEDELNEKYKVSYKHGGKDILDPVYIKRLAGSSFNVKAPETIVTREVKEDGSYVYYKYTSPSPLQLNVAVDNAEVNFVYSVKSEASEADYKNNKNIPGYDKDLKKIQEKIDDEKGSKNNQSKQYEDQIELNIRHIGLYVCRINACQEHWKGNTYLDSFFKVM